MGISCHIISYPSSIHPPRMPPAPSCAADIKSQCFEKRAETKQILSSRKDSFALPRPHFAPPHCANTWRVCGDGSARTERTIQSRATMRSARESGVPFKICSRKSYNSTSVFNPDASVGAPTVTSGMNTNETGKQRHPIPRTSTLEAIYGGAREGQKGDALRCRS